MACTDGLWGTLKDEEMIAELSGPGPLRQKLLTLGERAIKRAGAGSDNTTAAAVRWLAE
jgi:serine/threonine protein phosphatase PrpC